MLAAEAPDMCASGEIGLRQVASGVRRVFAASPRGRRAMVLRYVRESGAGCTAADICEYFTHFTRRQIDTLVSELEAGGYVEREKLVRGRGRPSYLIRARG